MKKFKNTCSTCTNMRICNHNPPYNYCKIDNKPIHNCLLRLYCCNNYVVDWEYFFTDNKENK